jgi:hypothetical protein
MENFNRLVVFGVREAFLVHLGVGKLALYYVAELTECHFSRQEICY